MSRLPSEPPPIRQVLLPRRRFALAYLFIPFFLAFAGAFGTLAIRHADMGRVALGLAGFSAAFLAASIGVVAAIRREADEVAKAGEEARREPDRPWLWRGDRRRGVIESRERFTLPWIAGFALVSWAVVLPWLVIPQARAKIEALPSGRAQLFAFCVIAAGFSLWAARVARRWRRFGGPVLRLSVVPGVVGGRLAGA